MDGEPWDLWAHCEKLQEHSAAMAKKKEKKMMMKEKGRNRV
jgi:hypothetical protein